MSTPTTGRGPRLVAPATGRGPRPTRTVGVVVIDLTQHVEHTFLSTHRVEVFVPFGGFPPGTNVELHIGHARDVYGTDPTLYEIARATHGCTVVVKGFDIDGVHAVQAALDRMNGFAPDPERHGCGNGGCDLLNGSPDRERNPTA